jgi:hypothetical protein
MKKIFFVVILVSFVLWLASCTDEPNQPQVVRDTTNRAPSVAQPNPSHPTVPEATVPLITVTTPKDASRISGSSVPAELTPTLFSATLRPGQSVWEAKSLYLPSTVTPEKLDLLISFDLTGSMGEELANVKVNSVNIMNAIKTLIPDSRFGVVSHMDYPGDYTGCDYPLVQYGDAACSDYAYHLDMGLTDNTGDVATAIDNLVLGCGSDGPEDYTRVFYESYSDPGIVWRDGAKRIVMSFLDAIPHDCAVDQVLGGPGPYMTTGPDPGRDAAVGGGDDLEIIPVLDAMKAAKVTLIPIYSGDYGAFGKSLWDAFSAKTTGAAFEINPDGTIPGGIDIADFIAGLVGQAIVHIDQLDVQTCDPAYSSWITSVTPPGGYSNLDLGEPMTLGWNIQFTPPDGTPSGEYCFEVCALGDDVQLASQRVCITVVNDVPVGFDFHPTSCPNPFNMNSDGTVPAAIVGASDFNVMMIDPATITLDGVPVQRWAYQDVVAGYTPYQGKDDCMDCTRSGADGYIDLTLKFDARQLAGAFAGAHDGDCRVVHVGGNLRAEFGGAPITGEDIIKIVLKPLKTTNESRGEN